MVMIELLDKQSYDEIKFEIEKWMDKNMSVEFFQLTRLVSDKQAEKTILK